MRSSTPISLLCSPPPTRNTARRRHHRFDLARLGNVGMDEDRLPALAFDHADGFIAGLGHDIDYRNFGPTSRKLQRRRAPDVLPRAGHYRHLALETCGHRMPPRVAETPHTLRVLSLR